MDIPAIQSTVVQNTFVSELRPLIDAVNSGNLKEVERFLQTEDVNAQDEDGWTALMYAVSEDCDEGVLSLLLRDRKNLDVNKINNEGQTALIFAAECHSNDAMILLLDAGADVNIVDGSGGTALLTYLGFGLDKDINLGVVKGFIDAGVNVNAQDGKGRNALMLAFGRAGDDVKMELLKAMHGRINDVDLDGYSVLMRAAEYGSVKFVDLLVDAGAIVNSVAQDGMTALELSLQLGDAELIDFVKQAEWSERNQAMDDAKLVRASILENLKMEGNSVELDDSLDGQGGRVSFAEKTTEKKFVRAKHESDFSERALPGLAVPDRAPGT